MELNKNKKPTGSGSGGSSSKWRFFKTLSSLKDIETPRQMIRNISTPMSVIEYAYRLSLNKHYL